MLWKFFPLVARAKYCSRQRSQAWSENMSSRRTSTWQSSLYKNLFMMPQVERNCSRMKSQTWFEKHEQTSNINVAEIILAGICLRISKWESQEGMQWFQIVHNFLLLVSALKRKSGCLLHRQWGIKEKIEDVVDSSGSLPILTMCDSTRFCFCALPGLPRYWEVSNNPKTTTTILGN